MCSQDTERMNNSEKIKEKIVRRPVYHEQKEELNLKVVGGRAAKH